MIMLQLGQTSFTENEFPGNMPFFNAFCFSDLRCAVAGLTERSLSLAILLAQESNLCSLRGY